MNKNKEIVNENVTYQMIPNFTYPSNEIAQGEK